MDVTLLINAFQLLSYLTAIVLAAIFAGAVASGIVRVVMQIDDASVGFTFKVIAFSLFVYLGWGHLSGELLDFAGRIWNGADFYH